MSLAPPDPPTTSSATYLLRDVGAHLDLGLGATEEGHAELVAAVLASLPEAPVEPIDGGSAPGIGPPSADRRRPPRLLVAAAVLLVIGLAVLTDAPAREAVSAGSESAPSASSGPTSRWSPARRPTPARLPSLRPGPTDPSMSGPWQGMLEVRLPTAEVAGEPTAASAGPCGSSGLIEVRYPGFTLVELASQPGGVPVLAKFLGPGTETTPVTVAGQPGLWITGDAHEVAFIDPDGTTRPDPRPRPRATCCCGRKAP